MKRTFLFVSSALAIAALTLANPTPASAGSVLLSFAYPARFCQTSTPGAWVQPNSSGGIGNWSGSPQGVDCPFIADGNDYLSTDVFRAWLYTSVNGVSNCMIMAPSYGGASTWYLPPVRTQVNPTFWRLEWDHFVPDGVTAYVQSIHCTLNNYGMMSKYSVKRYFNN